MAGEKLVKNFTYIGEPDELLVPEWVQKNSNRIPRLKPEYRTAPSAPWSPNKKAFKEIKERKALFQKYEAEQQAKFQHKKEIDS